MRIFEEQNIKERGFFFILKRINVLYIYNTVIIDQIASNGKLIIIYRRNSRVMIN